MSPAVILLLSVLLMPLFSSICPSGVWVNGSKWSMASFDFWLAAVLVLVWQISMVWLLMTTSVQGSVEWSELEFTRHLHNILS